MCIFSGTVESVDSTRIFMRELKDYHCVVYDMKMKSKEEVAMILPVECLSHGLEDRVKPVDLSGYPEFFDDMDKMFPVSRGRGLTTSFGTKGTLKVHRVGSFIFSYVPTMTDFDRVDEQFRMPSHVFDQFEEYRENHGFCVFQLMHNEDGTAMRYHPMAYKYPALHPKVLKFPTAHSHGPVQEAEAEFDHCLYYQLCDAIPFVVPEGQTSKHSPKMMMDIEKTLGLVDPGLAVVKIRLEGKMENGDVRINSD